MKLRIAINRLGVVGRNILRTICANNNRERIEIVLINNNDSTLNAVHSLCYEDGLPRPKSIIGCVTDGILVDGQKISYFSEDDFYKVPWKQFEIDWLIDCTDEGLVTLYSKEHMSKHAEL